MQDAEIFELRLQRDQALAQAKRLRERLHELFGPGADASGSGTAGAGSSRFAATGRGKSNVMSPKEAEMLSTITNLKTALEKATASSTPTTKYMAVSGNWVWSMQ